MSGDIYESETIEDLALVGEFDAEVWAAAFVGATARTPEIAHDAETILTWFATAIMAGYDRAKAEVS
jgi:hypothetical protein